MMALGKFHGLPRQAGFAQKVYHAFQILVHIANLIRGVVGQKTRRIGERGFGGDRTGKPEAEAETGLFSSPRRSSS